MDKATEHGYTEIISYLQTKNALTYDQVEMQLMAYMAEEALVDYRI